MSRNGGWQLCRLQHRAEKGTVGVWETKWETTRRMHSQMHHCTGGASSLLSLRFNPTVSEFPHQSSRQSLHWTCIRCFAVCTECAICLLNADRLTHCACLFVSQYFDMLRDVGGSNKSSTLFLPHSPAGLGDISGQIR